MLNRRQYRFVRIRIRKSNRPDADAEGRVALPWRNGAPCCPAALTEARAPPVPVGDRAVALAFRNRTSPSTVPRPPAGSRPREPPLLAGFHDFPGWEIAPGRPAWPFSGAGLAIAGYRLGGYFHARLATATSMPSISSGSPIQCGKGPLNPMEFLDFSLYPQDQESHLSWCRNRIDSNPGPRQAFHVLVSKFRCSPGAPRITSPARRHEQLRTYATPSSPHAE